MTALRRAASYARLYGLNHALTATACAEAAESADRLAGADDRTALAIRDDSLFLNRKLLATTSLEFNGLIKAIQGAGIENIAFEDRVDPNDITSLVAMIGGLAEEYEGGQSIALNEQVVGVGVLESSPTTDLRRSYTHSLGLLRNVGSTIRSGGRLDLDATSITVSDLLAKALSQPTAALLLASVKSHHEYTYYHSVNTCILSLSLGRLAGLPEEDLLLLGMGALLHDIGKIEVSTAVLSHPGRLSPAQWAEIRRHPQVGAQAILEAAGSGQEVTAAVAFEHHARFDGSGYPRLVYHEHTHGEHGAANRSQHFFSRLVAVADTYDAMTTRRSYRRAEPPSRALHVLLSAAGSSYDPDFTLAFVHMMGMYPPGSFLRLSDGRIVMVTDPSPGPDEPPSVAVVADTEGRRIATPEPVAIARTDVVAQLSPGDVDLEPAEVLELLSTAA
jgi:putative nucleotidyltransferase with HDIG domain